MFNKLDMLDRAPADGVVDAMIQCGFKASDVSKINSPLLDGIWKGVTGRDPDGQSELEPLVGGSMSELLLRLLIPRPFMAALNWFITKRDFVKCTDNFASLFIVCSSLGAREPVETLLTMLAPVRDLKYTLIQAARRAVMNGRVDVLHAISAALLEHTGLIPKELLWLTTGSGHTEMLRYLLHPSRQHLVGYAHIGSALDDAIQGQHVSSMFLLLEKCQDRLNRYDITVAFERAAGLGSVEMVQRLSEIAQSRGMSIRVRLSDLRPLISLNNIEGMRAMLAACQLDRFVADGVLMSVCTDADVEMARMLMENERVDVMDSAKWLHLLQAVLYNKSELVMYLLGRIGMRVWSDSAVRTAALLGHLQLARSMLGFLAFHDAPQAAYLQAELDSNDLFLMWTNMSPGAQELLQVRAAQIGHASLIHVVCSEPVVKNNFARFLVSQAAINGGHAECARYLLPSVRGMHRPGSLEVAARVRDPAMMRLVIDELLIAAAVRAQQIPGLVHSAIHLAAVSGHADHVGMLLDWLVPQSGDLPRMISLLKAAFTTAREDRCLAVAAATIHLRLYSTLECDDILDPIDRSVVTAVRSGNLAMVELHLNAGANVRHNANEALRLAESQGHAAMVELLKARGAGSG